MNRWHKLRTYPLRWLDWLLTRVITPFSEARSIPDYGRRGYYLLGAALIVLTPLLWALGIISGPVSQLPAWLRDALTYLLGLIGLKDLPTTIPVVVLIVVIYIFVYFIKPARIFIGEKFADLFFWTANVGINLGEWCLEHRWASLFVVVCLVSTITAGTYYLFDATRRNDKLAADFQHWLDQVDNFSDRSTVLLDESHSYKQVSGFWNEDYQEVVKLPDGHNHSAFVLHKMFDDLYLNASPDMSWNEFLRAALPKLLDEYSTEYKNTYAHGERRMTDPEKRAWALMNILLGRIYVRLGHGCSDCPELVEAKKYFNRVGEREYQPPAEKRYQAAVHNGLGTLYANVLTSMLQKPGAPPKDLQPICRNAAECASLALDEYARVEGDACSFEGRRRENNTIDLLVRIGLNYERLSFADINLNKVCGRYVRDGAGLARCVDQRLKGLVECSAYDPFIPQIFITTAQAYGVSVELRRRADPNADVTREVAAAGNYLRLAYMLNKDAQKNIKNWDLCYFRFALRDEKLGSDFRRAVASGFDHLPSPDPDYLTDIMERDAERCQ